MRLAAGIVAICGAALIVVAGCLVRTELGIAIAGLLLILEARSVLRIRQ